MEVTIYWLTTEDDNGTETRLFNSKAGRDAAFLEWIKIQWLEWIETQWRNDVPFPEDTSDVCQVYEAFQEEVGLHSYAWVGSEELEDH